MKEQRERRVVSRFQCDGVTIVCEQRGTNEEPFEAVLKDISMNGAAILIPRRLVETTPLLLRIRGDSFRLKLDCSSRVIHCRRYSSTEWIAGCEFRKPLTAQDVETVQLLEGHSTIVYLD